MMRGSSGTAEFRDDMHGSEFRSDIGGNVLSSMSVSWKQPSNAMA